MFSKVFKSLILIYLVFMMMPAGILSADLTQPTIEDMLREELDKPITEEILLEELKNAADGEDEIVVETPEGTTTIPTDELDPVTQHILDLCPDLTQGEYNAIQNMMIEQLNTPNGQNNYQFYIKYLSNSPEIIKAYGLTATEVVKELPHAPESQACKDFDRTIKDYGHMTSDQKIEFLLTQTPGLETTMKILDQADNHKKNYIFEQTKPQLNKVQTLADELNSKSIDYIISHAKAVKKEADELGEAQEDYYHAVSLSDKKYDVYEEKPEKKEKENTPSSYIADAYQNILTVNEKLNYKGKISNMDYANESPNNIMKGDLLQLRVTNSNISKAFPMFKYMVVREDLSTKYRCEDLSLKVFDIKGEEIPIDQGKEGKGNPYKIKIESSNNYKFVSKDFMKKTHDQYALLMNYSIDKYRDEYVGDLFRAGPIGIEELNDRIKELTPPTEQSVIDSLQAQKNAGMALWITGTGITAIGAILMIIGGTMVGLMKTATIGIVVLTIGGILLGAGVGMITSGSVMDDTARRALETANTNDNKRKNEIKDLFRDIDRYNKFTNPS